MSVSDSNSLCLECGLCCNGVIFARGQLQCGDDPARLRSLGLAVRAGGKLSGGLAKFVQPCTAFQNCHCQIYAERPQYCRQFECLLLKRIDAGKTSRAAALRVIRKALRRAETVKGLLRELGDVDEHVALSLRFRRMQRRFETSMPSREAATLYGQLTLAVHDLNVLLSDAFYS